MKEADIDEVAQKIFSLIKNHNSDKNNRIVKIQEKYNNSKSKNIIFQLVWDDDRKSTHGVGAIIKKENLDKAEFYASGKKITIDTEDLPKKIEQALAEIPKN